MRAGSPARKSSGLIVANGKRVKASEPLSWPGSMRADGDQLEPDFIGRGRLCPQHAPLMQALPVGQQPVLAAVWHGNGRDVGIGLV